MKSRDHILALLVEMDLRYQQRFDAQDLAISKAEFATEKRFEAVNEFRQALSDQTNHLLQRSEYISAHNALVDQCGQLSSRMDRSEGSKSGVTEGTKMLIAIGGFIIALIVLYLGLR